MIMLIKYKEMSFLMSSILGATLFGIIAIMTLLVTLGMPFGEYTMGRESKILP